MWIYALASILFLGFFTATVISIYVVDKQKTIKIYSKLGRRTTVIEIINVNIALILVGIFVYIKFYVFIPALLFFIIFILLLSRVQSGMSDEGIFVGMTFIEWSKVKSYKILNDDIATFTIKIRANKRQYVFRCDKSVRKDIENILQEHGKQVTETIND